MMNCKNLIMSQDDIASTSMFSILSCESLEIGPLQVCKLTAKETTDQSIKEWYVDSYDAARIGVKVDNLTKGTIIKIELFHKDEDFDWIKKFKIIDQPYSSTTAANSKDKTTTDQAQLKQIFDSVTNRTVDSRVDLSSHQGNSRVPLKRIQPNNFNNNNNGKRQKRHTPIGEINAITILPSIKGIVYAINDDIKSVGNTYITNILLRDETGIIPVVIYSSKKDDKTFNDLRKIGSEVILFNVNISIQQKVGLKSSESDFEAHFNENISQYSIVNAKDMTCSEFYQFIDEYSGINAVGQYHLHIKGKVIMTKILLSSCQLIVLLSKGTQIKIILWQPNTIECSTGSTIYFTNMKTFHSDVYGLALNRTKFTEIYSE